MHSLCISCKLTCLLAELVANPSLAELQLAMAEQYVCTATSFRPFHILALLKKSLRIDRLITSLCCTQGGLFFMMSYSLLIIRVDLLVLRCLCIKRPGTEQAFFRAFNTVAFVSFHPGFKSKTCSIPRVTTMSKVSHVIVLNHLPTVFSPRY